ncbi:MAG: PilZ domain-containing protein [Vicinamibacteria bacterium]|jgi:DNA-binding response OmpR family regulator|nr:PilZ domain-containing protein [Vicinamibacteria bacterium]
MPISVLICGKGPLADAVSRSPLGRDDVQRHRADSPAAALAAAPKVSPRLVLVDRELPGVAGLIRQLRITPPTVLASIVIVAGSDFDAREIELLEVGANAVLRFPPDAEWEARLERLLSVPVRKQLRIKADLTFQGLFGDNEMAGRTLNVSRTGMLIECHADAQIGERFGFKLHFGFDDVVEGQARVVRFAGPHQFGCEFFDLEPWAQRKVEMYVERG